MEISPKTPENVIKNLLSDISKANPRTKHALYKNLHETKQKYEKEGEKMLQQQVTKSVTQAQKKEVNKIIQTQEKFKKGIEPLTNPIAKSFFLTYYSGTTLKKNYNVDEIFRYMINFIMNESNGKILIEETPENKKEFLIKID